jgi:citrate synthase
VDGRGGRLVYAGYTIQELAQKSSFEEVCFLLWNARLPNNSELADLTRELASVRELPEPLANIAADLPSDTHSLEALRTILSPVNGLDPEYHENSAESHRKLAKHLVSLTATAVAAFSHIREGRPPIAPRPDLGHAANFLYMLTGKAPDPLHTRALDTYLVLLADHGYNASTFTARVITSTLSDMTSAVCGAIGALKGPLHGGAAQWTMDLLQTIGSLDNVDTFIRGIFAKRAKVPGFGHRIYKVEDPRARVLRALSKAVAEKTGGLVWYEMSEQIDDLVAQLRGDKEIYPNVDFYSASLLYNIGIPTDMMTSLFAASRMAGWTAHVIEQLSDNRLVRPQSEYTGPVDLPYVPLAER